MAKKTTAEVSAEVSAELTAKEFEDSRFGEGTEWVFSGSKKGGANGAGQHGGVHTNASGRAALIKSDKNFEKNISEFLGSKIFGATNPGYGAEVFFTVPAHEAVQVPNDGADVYVRSEFFGGTDASGNIATYSDMYEDMDKHMSDDDKPGGLRKDGRPMMVGTRNFFNKTLNKAFDQLKYQGFEQIAPTSLLIGDFDIHTGNIGVVRDKDGANPKLVRIDFGGGFDNLTADGGEIHPHSHSRHPLGKPTNHFREFPRKLKLTPEFADSCIQNGTMDLSKTIDESFAEMEKYYTPKAIARWAEMAMPKSFASEKLKTEISSGDVAVGVTALGLAAVGIAIGVDTSNLLSSLPSGSVRTSSAELTSKAEYSVETIKNEFKQVMKARQNSLKEFGLEIKLGLLVSKEDGKYVVDRAGLTKLAKEHPAYFKAIADGTKKVRLRDKNIRGGLFTGNVAEKLIAKEVKNIISSEVLGVATEIASKPKTLASKAKGVTRDSFVVSQSPSSAVREQVIEKQNEFLRKAIELVADPSISSAIRVLSQEEFVTYARDPKNRATIEEALRSPSVKSVESTIYQSEIEGYKALQDSFKGTVTPLKWDSPLEPSKSKGEKVQVVQHSGVELCKLTQRTFGAADTPTTITLSNGAVKPIAKCRSIDFPLKIADNTGPVHISLAVQDENGRNIPKSKAVYFTADYDKSGKLIEVSCPVGVKFTSSSDDAVGYIERDGSIYTIPVNQGDYRRMMTEVEKNHGQAINTASLVPPDISLDSVIKHAKEAALSQAMSVEKETAIATGAEKLYMDADGFSGGKDVGGVTGSKQVKKEGKTYQLKPSILDSKWLRRKLAGGKDHQNFGEVIAAKIGAAIMNEPGKQTLVPNLSLVYDKDKKRCLVASEYLPNVDKGTLDDYAVEQGGVKKKKTFLSNIKYNVVKAFGGEAGNIKYEKHIGKVTTRPNPGKREFSIAGEQNETMRKDLANAIAISALTGDHDINPGNMMAIKGGRVARIDFGHAFNDLLNHGEAFGGQVRNKGNQILDFINREEVSGGRSKLWRDYDIMPSQDLANAFEEISGQSGKIKEGIDEAAKSFQALVADLKKDLAKDPENQEAIKHITDSLVYMNDAVKGSTIDTNKKPEEIINAVCGNLQKFCEDNAKKMKDVSKLMQMQVDIDKLIQDRQAGKPLDNELSLKVKVQYNELYDPPHSPGIYNHKKQGIEWCKLDAKTPAHVGNLDSYIEHRASQLGLNKGFAQDLAAAVRVPSEISTPLENPNLRASTATIKLQQALTRSSERSIDGSTKNSSGSITVPITSRNRNSGTPSQTFGRG